MVVLDTSADDVGHDGSTAHSSSDLRHRRLRWATTRRPKNSSSNNHKSKRYSERFKRFSITPKSHRHSSGALERIQSGLHGVSSSDKPPPGDDGNGNDNDTDTAASRPHRRIYVNLPLPTSDLDENGQPLIQYPRNKTRSAKYTPLTFIPKNLFLQFQNIANVYFLFIVILAFFPIFGSTNPGLGAVPIIVIVVLTAIKDAIEDYRRTILDLELNNSPTQILSNWKNPNVSEDNVSLWRRIKKASTRISVKFLHAITRLFSSKSKRAAIDAKERAQSEADALDDQRFSTDLYRSYTHQTIQSRLSTAAESYQMQDLTRPVHEIYAPSHVTDGPKADPFGNHAAYEVSEPEPPIPDYRKPSIDLANGTLLDRTLAVSGNARFKRNYWKNLRVGDIVRLRNDDEIPADIIVLSTSDSDGACYVETKNLDGETNLKVRQAVRSGAGIKHSRDCEHAAFIIDSEAPHANLYSYSGVVRWSQKNSQVVDAPPQEMAEPLTINNMLLRGCSIRNTQWIIGVVVFTGEETKIMLNSGETPSKRSRIARELNLNVIYNFVLLFIICFVSGVIEGTRWRSHDNTIQWFEFGSAGGTPALDGLISFWTGVILFQNLVPISLFISIEIIKTIQAFFIWSDVHMYYEPLDYPCTPKSWNISDDLGQIEYIFSDKTGTLTQNVMEVKKVTVNGVVYGEAYTEAMSGIQKRQGIDVEKESVVAKERIAKAKVEMLDELASLYKNPYFNPDKLTFVAPDYVADMKGDDYQADAVNNFMLALSLCHSVLTEKVSEEPPVIEFKAQSPDEAALVATARDTGFSFVDRTQRGVIINAQGDVQEYQVLTSLEFNSSRKRMSAIIKMPEDGRIILFCKGADSVIYSRLRKDGQDEIKVSTAEHLEQFANEGLRTLCIAQRELSQDEYDQWSKEYDEAASSLENREDKMEVAADRIERELMLLGGTAIEDRLQDGVPDAISLLALAGVKLWVLTGDRVETAINIGFSCNILNTDMEIMVFQVDSDATVADAEKKLAEFSEKYFQIKGTVEELEQAKKDHSPPGPGHALVIDGEALKLVLDESLKMRFLLMCKQCKSVLCCRVSPSQKAAVVKMVKTGLDVITLAIGDGANDVAMIQAADIGVGIAGEEGRQAVMSSDYAIGQFKYLSRLLLIHGRWSYRRIGEMVANFFYKNIVFTFTLFWYQIYNDFDGSFLFDYTYLTLYNLAFTSLPVILLGILDQDVSDKVSLAVPELFQRGILRKEWTQVKFWEYMIDGLYQSVISFFFTYLLFFTGGFVTVNGLQINQREAMGVFACAACTIAANCYVTLNMYRWDWLYLLIVVISTLLLFFWTGVYTTSIYAAGFYGSASEVFGSLIFWASVLCSVVVSLLPRLILKCGQKLYYPRDVDIIRERVQNGEFDYLNDFDADRLGTSAVASLSREKSSRADSNGSVSVTGVDTVNTENGKQNFFLKSSRLLFFMFFFPFGQAEEDGEEKKK
ncbi:hypothetical protein V1514DRAFT_275507 [Lipomyces japonicus]|uniref:uncharacterized protein n=1 Tax=Lipomyces japonicus TaxID=56871 RepID=UPI0034CDB01D